MIILISYLVLYDDLISKFWERKQSNKFESAVLWSSFIKTKKKKKQGNKFNVSQLLALLKNKVCNKIQTTHMRYYLPKVRSSSTMHKLIKT